VTGRTKMEVPREREKKRRKKRGEERERERERGRIDKSRTSVEERGSMKGRNRGRADRSGGG